MNVAEMFLHAHLKGNPTVASVGVIYGQMIGADCAQEGCIDWPRAHKAIRLAIAPSLHDRQWASKLDRIKKLGWDFYGGMCQLQKEADQ